VPGARRPRGYRYGKWTGGPDPLAPPYDVAAAVDEIGDQVLAGAGVREAMRDLLRRGVDGRRGLDQLRRNVRDRLKQARKAGRMDGTLEEVRELLDRAVEAERTALFPDPDDAARLAEQELDALPQDTAGAVRALKDKQWRSPEAAQAYQQIKDLLQQEVLDSSFQGMKQALQQMQDGDGAGMQAVKDMVADLSALVDAHNRGEDTDSQFADFMGKHGEFFPDSPESVEELIDALARRAAAQQRMMAGLSPEQRAELQDLMGQAMGDLGLQSEMAHLNDALRQARPDLPWGQGGPVPDGEQGLGMGDATSAVGPMPSPCSPTWRRSASSCRRATRAPRWPTSTRSCWSRRWVARPSTTWRRCASWSANWSGRATSTAARASSSCHRRRSAGWAPPRCAGSSPNCRRPAAVSTTSPTPAPPVS
jgi:uncharacterized protein with von Willebrand factor type A (vWA) domain